MAQQKGFNPYLLVLSTIVMLILAPVTHAADSAPSRDTGQTDVTILHVDKFGVYAPRIVFYWDSSMSKQKLDALTRAAEGLKNKKATITYSAAGNLSKDSHPLLVDIVPFREETRMASREAPPPARPEDSSNAVSPPRPSVPQKPARTDTEQERASVRDENEDVPGFAPGLPPEPARPVPSTLPARSPSITKEEVIGFVEYVLHLNESKDINAVMSCYAEQVNYYDRGVVDRAYIKRDMSYYFKNWTTIGALLDGDVVLIVTDQPDVRIAKFVSRYSVENAKKSIVGRVENVWWVQRVDGKLRIIDQKQKILNSETNTW